MPFTHKLSRAMVRRSHLAVLLSSALAAHAAGAQAPAASGARIGDDSWRLGAGISVLAPRSAVVMAAAGGTDTRINPTTAATVDVQYIYSPLIAIYGNGAIGFTSLSAGSTVTAAAGIPSTSLSIMTGSAGVVLSPRWLGETLRPTLRAGAGYKGYRFDATASGSQWRPTGDFGVGLRAAGNGPIEVSAEVRYLPSSFDQGKLPLRSVVPQAQRQTDLMFGIGVSIRP